MSLFQRFAYRSKKEVMVVNNLPGGKDKDNEQETGERKSAHNKLTPSKAPQNMIDLTKIAETPNSLLPTPPKDKNSQEKRNQRRRRRARISSSSEEEDFPITTPRATNNNSLFSGLPLSKRSKKGEPKLRDELSNQYDPCERRKRQNESSWYPSEYWYNGKPKRLIYGTEEKGDENEGESESERLSPRSCWYSESIEKYHRNPGAVSRTDHSQMRKKQHRKGVLDLSSDSDEDLPQISLASGAKSRNNGYPGGGSEVKTQSSSRSMEPRSSSWLSARYMKLQELALKKRKGKSQRADFTDSESDSLPNGSNHTCSTRDTTEDKSSDSELQSSKSTDSDCFIVDSRNTSVQERERAPSLHVSPSTSQIAPKSSRITQFYGRSSSKATKSFGKPISEEKDLEAMENEMESFSSSEDEDYTAKEKDKILEFLNGCEQEEMCDIPNCSLARARTLVSLRPFEDWSVLTNILATRKGLTDKIIEGCLRLLEERCTMKKILSKCEAISATIQEDISKFHKSPEIEGMCDGILCLNQPAMMNISHKLKPYQLVGLNWMVLLHSHQLNGILADEMGLGKTVQAIAFLAHLYERERDCDGDGVFLIIVPSSTIENWARELERWCPSFKVMVYHGSLDERASYRDEILSGEDYDVILSTYTICISKQEDRMFFRRISLQCLVLDEAHMLKNMASQRYAHLMRIKAKRRLLLTGTPLQNNLLELMSLLSFVMPEVFKDFPDSLKKTFSRKIDEFSSYYNNQVNQAKKIMQPFILRRLKSEVLKQLPAKIELTEFCNLTDTQQQLYTSALQRSRCETTCKIDNMEDLKSSTSVITELRKIAMHPLLIRHHYDDVRLREMSREILKDPSHKDADPTLVYEDMIIMSDFELHSLCCENQVLAKYALSNECLEESAKFGYLKVKLKDLKDQGSRVLLFSQFRIMLDVVESFLQLCGHTYLRLDGGTQISERQDLIDRFNSDDKIFIFLLSTRAGGLGINLTSANVVIIHDIDFNPYNDKQAEDRCHRVGQMREVSVYRLICKDTIEEDILRCAQAKLKLEKDINTEDDGLNSADVAAILKHNLSMEQ